MENFAQSLEPMPSKLMRAIALILNADAELAQIAEPHFDVEMEYVDWPSIFRLTLNEEQKTALLWAQCLWLGKQPPEVDLIKSSAQLGQTYRLAVLEALCLYWGFRE